MKTSSPYGNGRFSGVRHYCDDRFYVAHSALVVATLCLGVLHNGGHRKYISVNPLELHRLLSGNITTDGSAAADARACSRAYVNAHAATIDDDFAAVCCPAAGGDRSDERRQPPTDLCDPHVPVIGVAVHRLPFATQLGRLSCAWLLPLSPILIRLVYQLVTVASSLLRRPPQCQQHNGSLTALAPPGPRPALLRTTLRRLLCYVLLIAVRTFGLYVGADAIEDYLLSQAEATSDRVPACWYAGALKPYQRAAADRPVACYGRDFDFSDHVVLFLAQYFPVFVMEILFCHDSPFWLAAGTETAKTRRRSDVFFSLGHIALFLYLHLVVLYNLYHTAVYFHTPAETVAGFGISLIVQVPVCYVMCSASGRVRTFLGWYGEERMGKGD